MRSDGFASAEEVARHYLREEILSGNFRGGTRISQHEIAATLGVSRMPVRDAIRRLEREGLITIASNRRAVVTRLTAADVAELFQMRAVLEGLAVRLTMRRLTRRELAKLESLVRFLERSTGDLNAWLPRHEEFHDLLCRRSEMPRLTAEIHRLQRTVQPYLRVFLAAGNDAEADGGGHRLLLAALKTGDAQVGEEAARAHVLSALTKVVTSIRQQGGVAAGLPLQAGRGDRRETRRRRA